MSCQDEAKVYLSDLESSDLEEVNSGEDELREAAQYICGKLFKEMWSTDKKNGFPLPKGCFFTTVGRQERQCGPINAIPLPAREGRCAGEKEAVVEHIP